MAHALELANPDIKIELLHTAGDHVATFKTVVAGATPPDVLDVNSPSLNELIVPGGRLLSLHAPGSAAQRVSSGTASMLDAP